MHRYRIALQRPSKLFDGMTGGLAPAIRSGMELAAGGGAACGDAACGNAAWDGAWTTSVCSLGLLAGAGTGFDVAPEGTAAVCVGAGLVFAVVGATAGAAVAAGWLPPMPNQLPIVCRVDVDRSEHTSELQSLTNLVCRLLLEKKKRFLTWSVRSWRRAATLRPQRTQSIC